jgi:hypothetical protein
MSDRFDLEQQILECWKITDDIKLLDKNVLEGKAEGGSMTQDEISNFLLGLETIYNLKFEQMFDTFSKLVNEKKIH